MTKLLRAHAEKKRLLIYGINYYPELTGIGKYTYEMVEWLRSNGHHCTVITAFPYYPYWKVQKPYRNSFYKKEMDGSSLTTYRCPLYVPAQPTGMKRVLHDASFFISSLVIVIKLLFHKKFDLFITVAPPFHLGMSALLYRLIKGTRVVYHIQDLQVDAARELKMITSGALLSVLENLERFILRRVDHISTISAGMAEKIRLKIDKPIVDFPNWVNVSHYYPIHHNHTAKTAFGFKEVDTVILYSGNIGEKQGLDTLIEVAAEFKHNEAVKFVICGTGAYKAKLVEKAKHLDLTSVSFLPLQPADSFNTFLNMADVHLVLQKKDASDLVMPSKLTTILAVGGLVYVAALPGTSLYKQVHENSIGLLVEPENVQSLFDGLNNYLEHREKFDFYKTNARQFAVEKLSINTIMQRFIDQVLNKSKV